ncbi:hypothetical protein [Sulfurisphaera ohwakuensis]|uniref:Uncharacterized protein n=1 Tax=Sulfurisphaera ohwakuensis TaxID=69656 RepID=A0A650CGG4_SULOH|nr:hypothetical protein [Sulfurisphaera ohwakuensis]MBB5255147.1 hypothetical protein [Sulfurisphaera ohwakuensis]QGR16775.1 hypothetical protein D1869_05925 [Sulfurisphaera ohwakuensis]
MAPEKTNQGVAVIKTIRLPKKVVQSIEKIAFMENKKFNNIVNEELIKFVNYVYKLRKTSGNEIIISSRFFSLFIDLLNDDLNKIKELFYNYGKQWGKEYLILWNSNENKLNINFKSFINLITVTSNYSNLFKLNIEYEDNDNTLTLILHHNYNIKYSAALAGYYLGILEHVKSVEKISDIKVDVAENSVIFTISFLFKET